MKQTFITDFKDRLIRIGFYLIFLIVSYFMGYFLHAFQDIDNTDKTIKLLIIEHMNILLVGMTYILIVAVILLGFRKLFEYIKENRIQDSATSETKINQEQGE